MFIHKLPITLGILLMLSACGEEEDAPSETQRLPVHFEEELSIGDDPDAAEEYMFAVEPTGPTARSSRLEIRTDSFGNIYVRDPSMDKIRIFDSESRFSHIVGGPGEGPGEFEYLSAFDVGPQGTIIAYDQVTGRVTHFTETGEILSEYTYDHDSREKQDFQATSIRRIEGDRLLFINQGELFESLHDDAEQINSGLVHLYDESMQNHIASIGNREHIFDERSDFARHLLELNPGYFWPQNDEEIWFASNIYDGHLYRFGKDADGWQLAEKVQGTSLTHEPLTHGEVSGSIVIKTFGIQDRDEEKSVGRVNHESLGVFSLYDGRLVHISSRFDGHKRETMVELFDSEGRFEGAGTLEKLSFATEDFRTYIASVWKDHNDRFYFVDNRDYLTIRVGKIKGI